MKMIPIDSKGLNIWFPVGGTVWEVVGGLTLLEEVWQWWWVLRVPKL